ncbi:hypothetical protein [Rhodoferax antarcticus]|uniref:TubC N-terminal docking domain-related protein n=1 Tax=Rhodoferax antarcticus TaxID=81479 RepID=UPI00095815A0|nr:hypothetical protein [Rhodoferax antarcticus]APW46919.1 hypothetical protein RA876_11740 [Rhodoferax antarcticus]
MTPHAILNELWRAGISIQLSDDGQNLVAPAGRLTPANRELVKTHRTELIALMLQARESTALLIAAAMRCCDRHGDGAQARDDMRQQCKDTPPHLRQDLLDHFNGKPANH